MQKIAPRAFRDLFNQSVGAVPPPTGMLNVVEQFDTVMMNISGFEAVVSVWTDWWYMRDMTDAIESRHVNKELALAGLLQRDWANLFGLDVDGNGVWAVRNPVEWDETLISTMIPPHNAPGRLLAEHGQIQELAKKLDERQKERHIVATRRARAAKKPLPRREPNYVEYRYPNLNPVGNQTELERKFGRYKPAASSLGDLNQFGQWMDSMSDFKNLVTPVLQQMYPLGMSPIDADAMVQVRRDLLDRLKGALTKLYNRALTFHLHVAVMSDSEEAFLANYRLLNAILNTVGGPVDRVILYLDCVVATNIAVMMAQTWYNEADLSYSDPDDDETDDDATNDEAQNEDAEQKEEEDEEEEEEEEEEKELFDTTEARRIAEEM